jgi:hypothetical protein
MNNQNHRLARISERIKSLCGLYTRVARRLGLDRSYVSRVARGERKSPQVESALISEFESAEANNSAPLSPGPDPAS